MDKEMVVHNLRPNIFFLLIAKWMYKAQARKVAIQTPGSTAWTKGYFVYVPMELVAITY